MELTFEQWREGGAHFRHRGHPIFYRATKTPERSAPNLLCIHGLPTASWDFHRLWPKLGASFREVLAADMIGFGWSDKPAHYEYSIFDQADLHETLLRERGVSRFRILAHDYGVTVAQELLARHDERKARGDHSLVLEAVCFLNGGIIPEMHRPLAVQKLMLTAAGPLLARTLNEPVFANSFRKTFAKKTQPSAREVHQFFELVVAGNGRQMFHRLFHYMPDRRVHRDRWVGAMQKTAVPLLLVNGAEDPISGAHVVPRYRELVPNPNTVLLAGIGHYPHVEAPDAVWRASRDLLVR